MEQFYKLTLSDALFQYKKKLISATTLVYYYLRIKRPQGWKITLYQEEICKELNIGKSTFYKAIAKLLKKNLIEVDDLTGIKVTILQTVDSSLQTVDSSLQTVDSSLQTVDSSLQTVDSSLQTVEFESPNPLPNKGSSDSPDILLNIYQIFTDSLSDSERESFLNFGNKLANQMPKPPALVNRWIEVNFEDVRAQWYKSTGKVEKSKEIDYYQHPHFEEWLHLVRSTGYFWMNDFKGKEKDERLAFTKWVYANNLMNLGGDD
jgi:hypothetical protein